MTYHYLTNALLGVNDTDHGRVGLRGHHRSQWWKDRRGRFTYPFPFLSLTTFCFSHLLSDTIMRLTASIKSTRGTFRVYTQTTGVMPMYLDCKLSLITYRDPHNVHLLIGRSVVPTPLFESINRVAFSSNWSIVPLSFTVDLVWRTCHLLIVKQTGSCSYPMGQTSVDYPIVSSHPSTSLRGLCHQYRDVSWRPHFPYCRSSNISIFSVNITPPTSKGDILRKLFHQCISPMEPLFNWVKCMAENMCLQARLKNYKRAGCTKVVRQCIPKLGGSSNESSCNRGRGNYSIGQ